MFCLCCCEKGVLCFVLFCFPRGGARLVVRGSFRAVSPFGQRAARSMREVFVSKSRRGVSEDEKLLCIIHPFAGCFASYVPWRAYDGVRSDGGAGGHDGSEAKVAELDAVERPAPLQHHLWVKYEHDRH